MSLCDDKSLNDERKKCQLTLKQVADHLCMSESNASYLLNGKRRMPLEHAEKLASLFNTSIEHIFLLYNFTRCEALKKNQTA